MENVCYKCDGEKATPLTELFGYTVCEACVKDLGLFTDKTIKKHRDRHDADPELRNYEDEIEFRLDYIEKYYISSKIKLLHLKERLEHLK
ncbi:MAG: hypothetical protein ACPGLV_03465 [Bacteroidia bacterium]